MRQERDDKQLRTSDMVEAGARREGRAEDVMETQGGRTTGDEELLPLLGESEAQELKSSWNDIQVRFVDDPRTAVEEADALVADVMQRVARVFANEREKMENRIATEKMSTEDLRVALQRYRSFFNRLLSLAPTR